MLQFHITRLFGLKFATHGVALPSAEGLKLVFRDSAAAADFFSEQTKTILIPWDNFESLSVVRGFLSTKVVISVHAPARLQGAPGLEESRVELKVHRSNLDQLEPFERAVQEYRSGRVDVDVDEFVDDVRDFLRDF